MQQYNIITEKYSILLTKLDTDEYEFSTTYNYLEYYGKSYLKNLSFVSEFQCYLNEMNSKIKIEHLDSDKFIMVQFPVPYSDKFELVQLKMLEIDEFKKINVIISKSSDDLKKQISDLKAKADESINKVLKNQLTANKEIKSKISQLEGEYKEISKKLLELKRKTADKKKNFIIGILINGSISNRDSDMYVSNPSDEIEMVNYFKKNKNKYCVNLPNDVYDELNKCSKINILVGGYSDINFRTITSFIEILTSCHFKLTNNSYITEPNGKFHFEYVKDSNIKSAAINVNTTINITDNINSVIFPCYSSSSGGMSYPYTIVYYY